MTGPSHSDPPAPRSDAPARPPLVRRSWVIALSVAALAAVGLGAITAWRSYRLPLRVQSRLPPAPDLAGKPRVLVEQLARARQAAQTRATVLDGVAELGRLYHANGYRREAEVCWRMLRAEQPGEPRWAYYLADLRRAASDYPGMTALLEEVARQAPDYAPVWLQLANLKLKSGDLDAAARDYRRRLELKPRDEYGRLGLARIALQRGQRADARRQLETLVHDFPDFSVGHNLYAEMLEADGNAVEASHQRFFGRETTRYREAADPWLDELNGWCYDFNRLCMLGAIEYQTNHGDRGRSDLERAVQLAPENPAGYELLGGLYLKLGDAKRARETLERGLRMIHEAPSPMLYVYLSQACLALHDTGAAIRATGDGLARAGDAFELHDARGVAFAEAGRQEEAVAAFREALSRNPNDPNANYNFGMSLWALGRQNEAVAAIKHSLALSPTFPRALLFLGRLELTAGHWEAAGPYLLPLYESHPEMPDARGLLAWWHLRAGADAEARHDLAAAEQHYREGLRLDGSRPDLHASLGVLCLLQSRLDEARAEFEALHRLQPENPQNSLFLGQTYARLGRFDDARKFLLEGEQRARQAGNTSTAGFCREILESLPPPDSTSTPRN